MNIFGKHFKIALASIFIVETFSLLGHFYPAINTIGFFALVLTILILSVYKLEYGIWMVLAELFIGSKGYLFSFELNDFSISIRIALWLSIMSVWLARKILKFRQEKISFLKSEFFPYFLILFIFIAWGIVNGLLSGNSFNNIFFDFNGWLYFALIFPVYDAFSAESNKKISSLLQIFTASVFYLSIKTFVLLYLFAHNFNFISGVYKWIRDTGVGEITHMQDGFYRIFIQSHFFVLALFFLLLVLIAEIIKNGKLKTKNFLYFFLLSVSSFAVVLISFSRSFWVGFVAGLILLYVYFAINKEKIKNILVFSGILLGACILSFVLVAALVKFPYPSPLGGFSIDLISERAGQISGEAGVSSRWALLPNLAKEIKDAPVLGKGFGATVTYTSSDPRILNSSLTGEYTTYAFEWGWLDVWLKIGLFGFLIYAVLIGMIFARGFKIKKTFISGLIIGLLVLAAVNFFSPYSNHPIGIGYLILISLIIDKSKEESIALA